MNPADEPKRGKLARIVMCKACLMILAPESGDDCPSHTLPCCGGHGASHIVGCKSDPMYQAGMRAADAFPLASGSRHP